MRLRLLPIAIAALALTSPPASAQVQPLAGTGENIQPIGRIPLESPNEVELAGDWAFVSDDFKGLVIVNVKDPQKPFIEGKWDCVSGWADVDISPDANIAILTNGHDYTNAPECLDEPTTVVILDVSDKKNPKLLSSIPYDAEIEYVHTATLDRNLLFLNPQAAAFFPQQNPRIPVYDIADPTKPVRKGFIPGRGIGLGHDTYVDHRPDGKTLLYSGSIHTSDVFDITDVMNPVLLQQVFAPDVTISHDVQPNWDRSILIVDDEGALGGQLNENVSVCGRVGGPGPAAVDSGSVHFYEAAPDGTFANEGAVPLGSYNKPANANEGACVAHVFWTAPDQNRMTQAYYRKGMDVIDFEDPANPTSLGSFVADGGSNYWSAKPHNGYIYATGQETGLDILRYTGEGGAKWPATAGPAEIQRYARHGLPYKPIGGASGPPTPPPPPKVDTRKLGSFAITARVKKRLTGHRAKSRKLTITFYTTSSSKALTKLSFKRKVGRKPSVRVRGVAEVGRYRWVVKVGRKRLAQGRFTVKEKPGLTLSPNAKLFARGK